MKTYSAILSLVFLAGLVPLGGCNWIQGLQEELLDSDNTQTEIEAEPESPTATPTPEPKTSGQIVISPSKEMSQSESLEVMKKRISEKERVAQGLSPQAPTPEPTITLIEHGGGVFSAAGHDLMWIIAAGGILSFDDASTYCAGLAAAGHFDWRLPQIDEVERIIKTGFKPARASYAQKLWSSTPHETRGYQVYDLASASPKMLESGMAHTMCVRINR